MTDVHNKNTRSYNMSQIRSEHTKPEILVRKYLFSKGFRYRLHDTKLPGKPDITLPKFRTVIFVNGCFWHGHSGCKYFVVPATRTKWWVDKINKTRLRDEQSRIELEKLGWNVVTVWECSLKQNQEQSLKIILDSIK